MLLAAAPASGPGRRSDRDRADVSASAVAIVETAEKRPAPAVQAAP